MIDVNEAVMCKPIDDAPDWADLKLSDGPGAVIVADARRKARDIFDAYTAKHADPGFVGFAMRGMSLAIADRYSFSDLERGMASSLRGIRNAFATRHQHLARNQVRSMENAMAAIEELLEAGAIPLPEGMAVTITIVEKDG